MPRIACARLGPCGPGPDSGTRPRSRRWRRGVGTALVRAAVSLARESGLRRIWLGTARPSDFARFGFQPISRWGLPLRVLLHKLGLVLQQPLSRWLPAILGRHRFMAMTLAGSGGAHLASLRDDRFQSRICQMHDLTRAARGLSISLRGRGRRGRQTVIDLVR